MPKLRIYANYKTIDGPWGGANNFLRGLEKRWAATDSIEYARDIDDDYDLLFLNAIGTGPGRENPRKVSLSYGEIKRLKTRGRSSLWQALVHSGEPKKIVLRAVTVEQWSFSRLLPTRRDRHVIAAMNVVDHVVFQTDYMVPVFRNAGYKGERFSVIHNGADGQFFHSRGRDYWDGAGTLKILSCTFSKRASKRFDLIAALSCQPGVVCTHVGNWPEDVPSGQVHLLGVLKREEIGDLMRQHHVFMHPAVKDPCPNAVQEALACGLPVLHSDDSGSAELVGSYGVSLDHGLAPALQAVRERYPALVASISRDQYRFSVDRAAEQYFALFETVATRVRNSTG